MADDNALVPVEPSAPSGGGAERELAGIAELRRTDISAYHARPDLKRRELELLRAQHGEGVAGDLKPSPADAVRHDLAQSAVGQRLVQQWDRGGFPSIVARVQDAATRLVEGIPAATRGDFLASFDGLPTGARHAVMGELGSGMKSMVGPAPDDVVKSWAKSPVGKALVAEFGHLAATKVAIIRARLFGAIDRMALEDVEPFVAWLDRIPDAEAKILFRGLAR